METRTPRSTRLQRVITALGVKPLHVVKEAARIARELGLRGISRQHFGRVKSGRAKATEEKIFIIVAALRELTGISFRAHNLFELEPEAVAVPFHSNASVPVSSGLHSSRSWRLFVPDEPGPSATEAAFEALYTQYGVLLRSIAMRRFRVPPDDAEALVHDTFVAYLERHTVIHDVKGWLIGAVSNACKHYWRDRQHEAPLLPEHDETADPAAPTTVERWMQRSAVVAVLAQLGVKCRETLRRYYLNEEPKEVIAEGLSTSPGYVLKLLIACRRRAHELFRRLAGPKE